MRDRNEHLSLEEILETLRSGAAGERPATDDLKDHLVGCHQCSDVAEQYRGLMGKLDQYTRAGQSIRRVDCPPAERWVELAAGVVPREEAEADLEHAGECGACSARLKEALEIVGAGPPLLPQLARDLKSSGGRWQRKLAQQMEERSRGPQEIAAGSRWLAGFSSRWAWATVAAAVLVAVGVAAYLRFGQASPEKLLAEAYTQQRTIELRINQAPYGPIRVQRDRGASQLNASSQLLEAEVAIKRRMVQQPENPDFLREKAEVDLLNWDYQPAIETLGHALRLQPQSFLIALDLGTAHFERAEATNSPADYEASLNYLGDAIRLQPGNAAALFNRAIVYERLYLYGRAIEDWEQFLKIEKDPGWRKEAEQHLQELRERERQRSQRQSPEKLTLAQFISNVKAGHAGAIEEYLEVAERQILPNIPASGTPGQHGDQNYQAARALADELESAHGDWFLKDLLSGAGQKDFQPAAKLLGKSSVANHEGRSDEAYADAVQAGELFRRSGNASGVVAAGFEQAYALQFQSKAASCEALAARLVRTALADNYAWFNIQLRLEQAICANMNREVGPAKNLTKQALQLAKEHRFQSLYLRGLRALANLESEAGNDVSAWSAIHEGLGLYWESALPTIRAYSFYEALDRMAERLNHPNVEFAAAFEALQFRPAGASNVVEASERARLGDAAFRIGNGQMAEAEFRQAQQVLASAPQTDFVRWRELEIQLWLARLHAFRGDHDSSQAEELLLSWRPEVESLSNRYLQFEYYEALATLRIRSGDAETGQQLLSRAILIAEDGLRSLPTWRERLVWMEQHRTPYIMMVELLFQSGKQEEALDAWEHFRVAEALPFAPGRMETAVLDDQKFSPSSRLIQPRGTGIITYAFAADGIMIWIRRVKEVHSVFLHVEPRNVQRAAENLIGECSRPDSDMSNLRADAQYLYKLLVQPLEAWLPREGHLTVEPDGILGVTPLEVLIDEEGSYLGARYSISLASSVRGRNPVKPTSPIQSSDRALVIAAPTESDGFTPPAAGATHELFEVAQRFSHPITLSGREVLVSHVGRELPRSAVFHFAGHAGLSRSGAAMLLADGILGADQAHALASQTLSHLKLAVFSACGTAKSSAMSDSDSLVTAFLQAGTQNVVATRWNVDSMATADFVDLFYKSLLSGASAADAIQRASASFRKIPERAHPYYWAAFAAFGRA